MNDFSPPRHHPYRSAGAIFQIGLKPMEQAQWLDVGADHAAFMKAKRQRVRGRPPLFYRSLPRSIDAQTELLDGAVAHLLAHRADTYARESGSIRDRVDNTLHFNGQCEPLELLGQMIEEDFILFEKEQDRDIITAASNAYTSSGRIVSTVGRTMHYAHEPVPGLNEQLGNRIDRVLANIKPDAPVVRFNWFVTPISARLFPEGLPAANVKAAEAVAAELHADPEQAGSA